MLNYIIGISRVIYSLAFLLVNSHLQMLIIKNLNFKNNLRKILLDADKCK